MFFAGLAGRACAANEFSEDANQNGLSI